MTFLILLALIVCIVALVITLILTKSVDVNYSSNRSLQSLSFIYIVIIPFIAIAIVVFWVLFN